MLLRRLSFFLACILLCICWIVFDQNLFGLLLSALILMAGVSLILFLYASSDIKSEIQLPENADKASMIPARIQLRGRELLSAMYLQPAVSVTNLLTGEHMHVAQIQPEADKSGARIRFSFSSKCCGKLSVQLEHILVSDPMGLFSRKVHVDASRCVLVLPDTFAIAVELQTPDLPDIESTDYSPVHSGDDPSELFGIRDYREGDPLRSIHWKLSEKYDRTVIREMSLPVAHSILLCLDNCPTVSIDPEDASMAAEALISLSQSLCEESIPHQISWLDHETGGITCYTVAALDDLYALQDLILSCRILAGESGIVSSMLEQDFLEYSHMLLFAAQEPEGLDLLANTTLLLPQAEPENGVSCLREQLEAMIL